MKHSNVSEAIAWAAANRVAVILIPSGIEEVEPLPRVGMLLLLIDESGEIVQQGNPRS